MNKLYFEGAGCVHAYGNSDIENCRIRTAFTNNEGKKIYLEMLCTEVTKYNEKCSCCANYKRGDCLGWVDSCHYITDDPEIDDCNASRVPGVDHYSFLFTKENLSRFINEKLNCSFDEIEILNDLTGYRVFNDDGKYGTFDFYNYGDEFKFDRERTEKRLAKREELKKYFEQFMKYDNTSYWVDEAGNLVVRINTYDSVFKQMKFKERQFTIEIK